MTFLGRDQVWLEAVLQEVWTTAFPDLVAQNRVEIRFGRAARTRLGSIRMARDGSVSTILMNRLFRDERVPREMVAVTVAHELTHYLHGFSSPLPRQYKSPHAGGVVTRDLKARGFGPALVRQKRWLKAHFPGLYREHVPGAVRRRSSRRARRPVSPLRSLGRALGLL